MQLQPYGEATEEASAKMVDQLPKCHDPMLIEPSAERIDDLQARLTLMQTHLENLLVPGMATLQELPGTVPGHARPGVQCQKQVMGASPSLVQFDAGMPLPTITETISHVEYYFENFNRFIPLFDEPSFYLRIEEKGEVQPKDDPAGWAAVNVALSITHRLRAIDSLSTKTENQKAWDYLRNAQRVVPELTLGEPSLLGVQALLGISIILQGTNNPRQASALVASTIRLPQSSDVCTTLMPLRD